MAFANFAAKYRPLKIGFFVPQDDIRGLIEAAKINTLLWGGMHNPIIPVGSNTKDIKNKNKLLKTFRRSKLQNPIA